MKSVVDELVIEPATTDDVDALCRLLGELFFQESEFTPDAELQRRGVTMILADPGTGEIWVARLAGTVVGMVNLLFTISTALGAPVALLEDVVVSSAHRHAGIGTQLLTKAIEVARTRGCRRMTLLTDADNAKAQQFYAQQGFARSSMTTLRMSLQ
jgi:GNAT superfamily N-acetyltransferase